MKNRLHFSFVKYFLNSNDLIPDITNPQNWNAYTYVKGNPISFNDPTGHMPIGGWGPVGSESNKAFPDNGEPPSLGGWEDDVGNTISNIKYQLMKAGFSKEAVDRAAKEGNLKPVVKVYVVHGEEVDKKGGHVAISATLGGESIWWSHGGEANLYGRTGPEGEAKFIETYRQDKSVEKIDVFTLSLSLGESIGVASQISKRVQYAPAGSKAPAEPKKGFKFNESIGYFCSTSTADILFQAGVHSVANPLVIWPETSSIYYEVISEKEEVFYPY